MLEPALNRFLASVKSKAGWLSLAKIQRSLISKALTSLSLATFLLANFGEALGALGMSTWRLRLLLLGSLLFICGYVCASLRRPPEFEEGATLEELVGQMAKVDDYDYFRSRLSMTQALVERFQRQPPFDLLQGHLEYAKQRIGACKATSQSDWKSRSSSLYHADLNLRQYDRPRSRWLSLTLLTVGMIALLVPTVASLWKVLV
jgi:hypothetical protein